MKRIGKSFFKWLIDEERKKLEHKYLPVLYIKLYHFTPYVLNKYQFPEPARTDGGFSFEYEDPFLKKLNYEIKVFLN